MIKVRKNVEIANFTSKLTPVIADPIDFKIEDSICVNNDIMMIVHILKVTIRTLSFVKTL